LKLKVFKLKLAEDLGIQRFKVSWIVVAKIPGIFPLAPGLIIHCTEGCKFKVGFSWI
jgi:hypothetical protein